MTAVTVPFHLPHGVTAFDAAAVARGSPADPEFFAFPAVREHLAFWPEKRYDRHLAVVAGVAVRGDPGVLTPQVRVLGDGDDLKGHFHGAVFPFRAIPQGRVELRSVLAKLFDALAPVGLLHLLHDRRPISGAGSSPEDSAGPTGTWLRTRAASSWT